MSFIEENLLGLIIMLVVAIGLAVWVLRSGAPAHRVDAPAPERKLADLPPPAVAKKAATEPTLARAAPPPQVTKTEPVPPPAPALATTGPADNLMRLKGVGPKLVGTLNGLGVTRYDQIAAWSDADIDRVDAQLGAFKGRPRRDQWVEQARLLAAGDTAGFEAKFGKV